MPLVAGDVVDDQLGQVEGAVRRHIYGLDPGRGERRPRLVHQRGRRRVAQLTGSVERIKIVGQVGEQLAGLPAVDVPDHPDGERAPAQLRGDALHGRVAAARRAAEVASTGDRCARGDDLSGPQMRGRDENDRIDHHGEPPQRRPSVLKPVLQQQDRQYLRGRAHGAVHGHRAPCPLL